MNFIRSRISNHCQFHELLSEIEIEHPELPHHAAIK